FRSPLQSWSYDFQNWGWLTPLLSTPCYIMESTLSNQNSLFMTLSPLPCLEGCLSKRWDI
ncbi:MAG: hypothetical protein P5702_19025, partial [Limnospira sp. PMC 1291.21]|nr:hypothetical protein [Limnospira sp. PMC 1238.20]MDT9194902.1 hypothetical protein [Limnospira sp. PMC 1245.20]MDT9205238.1 hypothetical protein [Limnospira sp. PMC 1243.20]MDT9210380.1 hypothetical protein [Limnospira sp. PMC 1252.20]MDT9215470.1 hypothetical protein [Limnospira sp. PMC 1256.20]MDT9220676.1 hypothetical protein [Limnospira sp. PMC 1240.20]MDT9225700.1 hypothetical protein [Limnospira sp. PMC 1279.21]MDT9230780.1 hypothetical protein [Limnospira sp. PMC 1242.20]MDT923575